MARGPPSRRSLRLVGVPPVLHVTSLDLHLSFRFLSSIFSDSELIFFFSVRAFCVLFKKRSHIWAAPGCGETGTVARGETEVQGVPW